MWEKRCLFVPSLLNNFVQVSDAGVGIGTLVGDRLRWGLRPHTDYGFVTILDTSAPGLLIEVNGGFADVPVLPGHLIINFGEALNFITAHSDHAVSAVTHRVLSQQSTDRVRHGIVYFANPDLDGMLWQFDASGEEQGSSSVKDLFALLEQKLTKTD